MAERVNSTETFNSLASKVFSLFEVVRSLIGTFRKESGGIIGTSKTNESQSLALAVMLKPSRG